jgi:UDP-N-acetylmuramoyl-tripeptide--D-alanyl-D-alanine ligase
MMTAANHSEIELRIRRVLSLDNFKTALGLGELRRRFKKKLQWVSEPVMYRLARLNRRLNDHVTTIGITGSAGKTTTKDLCATVLAGFGRCRSSTRGQNEFLPIVKLVGSVRRSDRYCIVEIGVAKPGDMERSSSIVKPNIAVVTLIARDHYSAFRSLEATAAEKGKLVSALGPNGVAVLNIDDPLVRKMGDACAQRVIWVGESEDATVRLLESHSNWPEPLTLTVSIGDSTYVVRTGLHGTHLTLSVLASLGVVVALRLPLAQAIAMFEKTSPSEGRMQIVESNDGVVFVLDDFKAPHWSFEAPLEFMGAARAQRKIVIVGTVSDSADSPSRRYLKIARNVRRVADLAIFVGPDAPKALRARSSPDDGSVLAFVSIRDARDHIDGLLQPGDLVLLKGTNRQDHLRRLLINRSKRVLCWKDLCRKHQFCERCSELFQGPKSSDRSEFTVPVGLYQVQPAGRSDAREEVGSTVERPTIPPAERPEGRAGIGPLVIVGLGNPGEQFRNTPHNAGYHVLELLAGSSHGTWEQHPEGLVSFINLNGREVALLMPGVSMNSSGVPLAAFLRRLGAPIGNLLVVYDEMDLKLSDVRLKRGGSGAGHKGIESVVTSLGTTDFWRVRVGVRPKGDQQRARQLVLERIPPTDEPKFAAAIEKAVSLIRDEVQVRSGAVTALP